MKWISYIELLNHLLCSSVGSNPCFCILCFYLSTVINHTNHETNQALVVLLFRGRPVAAIMNHPSIWFLFNCMFHVYTIQFFAKKKIKNITTCMIIYYCFTVLIYGRKLRRPIQNVVLQKTGTTPKHTIKSWDHCR